MRETVESRAPTARQRSADAAPPLYAHASPRIFGFPFFYWYQTVWLLLTAGITTLVYRKTR